MRAHVPLTVLTTLVAAACSESTGPEDAARLGTVWFYDEPVVVEVPDTARAASPFEVRVRTYGGGCHRMGATATLASGDTLRVTPTDTVTTGPDLACPDILRTFDHRATASWPTPGELTVVVEGWEEPAGRERRLARTVVVR